MTSPEHDFDFIYGRWNVHNRKLRDNTDPSCDDWVEFDATSEAFQVLEDVGHIDRIRVDDATDGPPFEGMTLRLYDPAEQVWRIWWSSTRARDPAALRLVRRRSITDVGATLFVRQRRDVDAQLGDDTDASRRLASDDDHAARGIDAVQERLKATLCEGFICRIARALIARVIVDDDHPAVSDAREQMLELESR
jgi:hypothetical protein